MNSEWVFSIDWTEEVEQGRREVFARQMQFANERDAQAAWANSQRFAWVEPHQQDAQVSPLYRLDFDMDNGQRSKLRARRIVADVPVAKRGAA